jgi:hypothetical protein
MRLSLIRLKADVPLPAGTLFLAFAFALFLSSSALADAVSGRIYGIDGKPAQNTTFTARPAKGQAVEFKSDASGNFSVYLEPGRYTVTSGADATVEGLIESYPQPVQQDVHLKKRSN